MTTTKKAKKIRTRVQFYMPKTRKTKKSPKYPRRSVERRDKMDKYRVIQCPVTTEDQEEPQVSKKVSRATRQDGQVPSHPVPCHNRRPRRAPSIQEGQSSDATRWTST